MPVTTSDLSAIEKAALAKFVKDSGDILPGSHEVDVHVHIKGVLRVGDDEQYTPTVHIPLLKTLAIVVHHAGVTGDAAIALIVKAMKQALNTETSGNDAIDEIESRVKEWQTRIETDMTAKLPKQTRKGKKTFSGECTKI